MSNKLQTTIIIALAVISFSIFYALVLSPFQRDAKLSKCLSDTYGQGGAPSLMLQKAEICVKQYK